LLAEDARVSEFINQKSEMKGTAMTNPRPEDKSTQNIEDAARRASHRAAEQTSRMGQAAAEQTNRMGQAAAEQTAHMRQAATEAGDEIARAGAQLLQRNAETLQNAWRLGLDMTTAVVGRSTDELGRTLGFAGNEAQQAEAQQAAQRSARNAETILHTSTAVSKLMGGMSQEYFGFVRQQMENSMSRMNELWRCRTAQDVAAVQSDLVRESMGSVLESCRRVADMSLKLADDAAKHVDRSAA
jgi:hypothetical protein